MLASGGRALCAWASAALSQSWHFPRAGKAAGVRCRAAAVPCAARRVPLLSLKARGRRLPCLQRARRHDSVLGRRRGVPFGCVPACCAPRFVTTCRCRGEGAAARPRGAASAAAAAPAAAETGPPVLNTSKLSRPQRPPPPRWRASSPAPSSWRAACRRLIWPCRQTGETRHLLAGRHGAGRGGSRLPVHMLRCPNLHTPAFCRPPLTAALTSQRRSSRGSAARRAATQAGAAQSSWGGCERRSSGAAWERDAAGICGRKHPGQGVWPKPPPPPSPMYSFCLRALLVPLGCSFCCRSLPVVCRLLLAPLLPANPSAAQSLCTHLCVPTKRYQSRGNAGVEGTRGACLQCLGGSWRHGNTSSVTQTSRTGGVLRKQATDG